MGGQVSTIKESLIPNGKKGAKVEKLGILSFEVANVMSKILLLWQSLSELEVMRLRTEVVKAEGVLNLVSENEAVLLSLACMEKLQDLTAIAGAVARVGKRCQEPLLRSFEHVFTDILKQNIDVRFYDYSLKDMDAKMKKMEQYLASTSNLYQELEMLADVEQACRRMQDDGTGISRDRETLTALEQKAIWHRQEVKYLRDLSLWNRSYEKVVTLLARTVCTIHGRILHVFGSPLLKLPRLFPVERLKDGYPTPLSLDRSSGSSWYRRAPDVQATNSVAATNAVRLHGGSPHDQPQRRLAGANVLNPASNTYTARVSPWSLSCARGDVKISLQVQLFPAVSNFMLVTYPRFTSYTFIFERRFHSSHPVDCNVTATVRRNKAGAEQPFRGSRELSNGAAVKSGSLMAEAKITYSPISRSDQPPRRSNATGQPRRSTGSQQQGDLLPANGNSTVVYFVPKNRHLNAPPYTLGGSALAIHYANVIIMIEKMVKNPHLISHDSRDDLYQMLPNSLRTALRPRLRASLKAHPSGYDSGVAEHWKDGLERILEWMAPLAHNMIKWQSEHNFEQQQCGTRSNILLLQTLFFADLEKTEAHIIELLVGLNYICGHEKEKSSLTSADYESQREQEQENYLEWQFQ